MTQAPSIGPGTPPPAMPQPPADPAARSGAGMSIAALVLGICAIIPIVGALTGLAAIILGIVALATKRKGAGMAIGGIVTGAVCGFLGQIILLTSLLLPTLSRSRSLARRAVSAANLNQIGKASEMYQANYDVPAPTLQHLVDEGLVGAKSLKYPGAGTGRDSDYLYEPPPPEVDLSVPILVACELKGDYTDDGRNVLYNASAVKWLSSDAFAAELAKPENAAFAAALKAAEDP